MKETATQRKRRLEKGRQYYRQKRSVETEAGKYERLIKRKKKLNEETEEDRNSRLALDRERHARACAIESVEDRNSRLLAKKERQQQARAIESVEDRNSRLIRDKESHRHARAIESVEDRNSRLIRDRERHSLAIAMESDQDHEERLSRQREAYANRLASAEEFNRTINTFCDKTCEICTKQCYPNQVVKYYLVASKSYLPVELVNKDFLLVCHRCNTHLKNNRKTEAPPKAFWNNLNPGAIPEEILCLTQSEQRLLSRIIPFIKVVKFDGRFGQYGFKGHATLFALDIFEVTEKLPNMLPRDSNDAGIVVVTETLENLNVSRDYVASRDRMHAALRWLIAHNPLYKDCQINHFARLDQNDFIRVIRFDHPQHQGQAHIVQGQGNNVEIRNSYVPLDENRNISRIVRSTWNQSNSEIYQSGFAGVQCLTMVLANIIRATILPPSQWNTNILNSNMYAGDEVYALIRHLTAENNERAHHIPTSGFLYLPNLDVIKDDILMYEKSFSLEYDDSWLCHGNLMDKMNDGTNFKTLLDSFAKLFAEYNAGVIIADSKSLGLMHYDGKFYFTDSHSCGPKGKPLNHNNGQGCIIECDTIEELHRICRRVFKQHNKQFSIHYINVNYKGDFMQMDEYLRQKEQPQHSSISFAPEQNSHILTQHVHIQTSVMAPIDVVQPDVEDELIESSNVNEIVRKTKDNIVNVNHEKKAEEFSFFYLFPLGINGLNEDRPVKISTLDYFQFRILGKDSRFQHNDKYLFYALAMFEYDRVKSTISACVKKVRGQEGVVEDLHIYMRNLRGSAAYWRTANSELVAQIRCLGPPTWFLTLSCNDLNWKDMRKALLIADNRPDEDPISISIDEAQRLIEIYPVVVSRHFQRRLEAFMKYLKANDNVLGGKIKDYWWRIEFQNRGSPHVHMVIWIENAPSFETEEGLKLIDEIVSCHYPSEEENPELHNLVKKNQIHRHTHTCHKNNSESCRFGFPRQACDRTKIVSQTSDEFIRNSGRICVLKRRQQDKYVNNYCSTVLSLWDGNMDIQPCGTNEAIAHYIAKYISKSEPTNLNESVAQAIRQIRREESNVSTKLFKVCMRILKERQVSACECAYRLCHLPFRGSSRKCVFLNTRRPEQRYHVLQFEGNQATGVCSNIFERYEKRPRDHPQYNFKDMCLLEFAMLFEPFYARKGNDNEESVDAEVEEQGQIRRFITLSDNTKMVIRNVPAVIRVPNFQMQQDAYNYFYSLLLQYVPYYSENELLEGFENPQAAFLSRQQSLRETSRYMEIFRERDRQLENAFNQARAFNIFEQPEEFEDIQPVEISEPCMSGEQLQVIYNTMNAKQQELFQLVRESIQDQLNGSRHRMRWFVTGGAGVGKTFTFNALKNLVKNCYAGKSAVKVGALTGVAAKLVGGSTLHSLLKMPVQKDGFLTPNMPQLTGNYLKIMRQQWKDVEYLFIDEISMVPYEMLCMIDSRLRQLKNKENEVFGGINIIVFGDLMQLPPVKGAQVFNQPTHLLPATHLWRLFSLCELTENMRQQGDNTFADLLNALRVGELNGQHFELLMSKQLTEATGDFAVDKAIRIYPKRVQVDAHNQAVLDHYRSQGVRIYKIRAQDQIIDATRNVDNVDMDKIVSTDVNKTGGLPKEIEIFVGAKVMLRSNINIEKGLVNGAIGNILEIVWPHFRRDQMYDTDVPSVRVDFGNENVQLIEPQSIQFPAKYNYGTIERRQLPIILCWACTVHKMQGCTVDQAVVYLGSSLFKEGQAYVALSRVRSLNGLRIEELDCSKLTGKKPCNESAIKEMERMRQYRPPEIP